MLEYKSLVVPPVTDHGKLDAALNTLAADGWSVVCAVGDMLILAREARAPKQPFPLDRMVPEITIASTPVVIDDIVTFKDSVAPAPPKRRGGRPPGSKNKPKGEAAG